MALSGAHAFSRCLPAVVSARCSAIATPKLFTPHFLDSISQTVEKTVYDSVLDEFSRLRGALADLGLDSHGLFYRGHWIGTGACVLTCLESARALFDTLPREVKLHYCHVPNFRNHTFGHAYLLLEDTRQREFMLVDPTHRQLDPLPTEASSSFLATPLVGILPNTSDQFKDYFLSSELRRVVDRSIQSDSRLLEFFRAFGDTFPIDHIREFVG